MKEATRPLIVGGRWAGQGWARWWWQGGMGYFGRLVKDEELMMGLQVGIRTQLRLSYGKR